MERVIIAATALVAGMVTAVSANASPLFEVGANAWYAQASGSGSTMQNGSQSPTVSLRNDLGMKRQWSGNVHLILRTPVLGVPNFLVEEGRVFNDGDNQVNRDITWQGNTYVANGRVQSQVALKTHRFVAFWSPLDNPLVDLRLGLEARWLNLDVPVTGIEKQSGSGTQTASTSAGGTGWLPLGYAGATVHLPAGIDVGASGSYVHYSSSYLADYRAQVSYKFESGLRLSLGWREFHMHLDSSRFSVRGDLRFKGLYTGIGFAF